MHIPGLPPVTMFGERRGIYSEAFLLLPLQVIGVDIISALREKHAAAFPNTNIGGDSTLCAGGFSDEVSAINVMSPEELLSLHETDGIDAEILARFRYVFVDEYHLARVR